jgi:hypothetical protein
MEISGFSNACVMARSLYCRLVGALAAAQGVSLQAALTPSGLFN